MGFVERVKGTRTAMERGRLDFHEGVPFSENPYRHFITGEGSLVFMNSWEEGWRLGEAESDPEERSVRTA